MNSLLKTMLIACFAMFLSVDNLSAQEVWEDLAEQLSGDEASVHWENMFEELSELREYPININTATKEQLERFPFLSDQLIENILYYLYKYGPMLTPNELLMVEDMDRQTMRHLLPFIRFQTPEKETYQPTLKKVLKYGKHELSTRVDIPLYTRKGYYIYPPEELEKNPNKQYIGYPYHHNVRYSFRYRDQIQLGITAENDAGEPYFTGRNKKGYDYYSPYLLISNIGKIKSLALGNYRLSYGYGLVMNTDFGMGKTATLSTLGNRSKGIRKHSSTDEYNYFQGIAASYRLTKRLTLDAFYSYRKMDGTVDSLFIKSLKDDGYHRLERDFEKKHTVSNHVIGSHLGYNGKYSELGLTAVYNVFNKVLNPDKKYYNTYYPRGKDFYNVSVDYKFFWKRFTLLGETAIDKCGAIATMNMLRYSPKGGTHLILMNRYYDKTYQAMYARSVSEGSSVQNEEGIYIGLETKLLKYVKLTTYADFIRFPWKRYLVSEAETTGFDGMAQISYSPRNELGLFIRYRYKNKKKDFTDAHKEKHTIPYIQQKARFQLNYSPNEQCLLKTTVDYARINYQGQPASQGVLVSQSGGYQWKSIPLQADVSATWFHTDDYASHLTLYEKSVLYAFSIPSFYYHGTRLTLNLRYELNKHIILQAKYGMTHYFNRDKISSGLDEINSPTKNDLYLQMRIKF